MPDHAASGRSLDEILADAPSELDAVASMLINGTWTAPQLVFYAKLLAGIATAMRTRAERIEKRDP